MMMMRVGVANLPAVSPSNRHLFSSDEFATPLSSLPSEDERADAPSLSQPVAPLELSKALKSATSVSSSRAKLYNDSHNHFLLHLSDLQVLIGKADEQWREAVHSGHSRLHMLDKFTLSVQL